MMTAVSPDGARASVTRPPIIRAFLGDDEIIVDLFAGGGGASTGIHRATGRSPDIAINHSPEAIALHAANHPNTKHYIESVYKVDPRRASGGRPVALLWLSPDCTHHSKAKGGRPRNQKLRGLAWSAIPWAQHCRPRVIVLENVEEWIDWGPVDGATGQPIKARKGQTFRAWRHKLESYGYVVEHRLLRAADYGAPTTRRRLFLIARCDGKPIAWPEPSHGKLPSGVSRHLELGARAVKPWRTAAEIIDWSIPCPSIFERDRPLADKTMARIARGIRKYVIESARPFVIAVNHGGVGRTDHRVHDLDAPMPTITGGQRGGHALVSPIVVKAKTHGGGGNDAMRADEPLLTASKRGEFAVCAAFLAKHYSARDTGGWNGGAALDVPAGSVTTRDHHGLVAAHLTKLYGTSTGADARDPMPTVTGGGQHVGLVAAFLARYNGRSKEQPVTTPIGTLDANDRYALVTVTIDDEEYAIVDIGMRMLTPRELFRAQGFADDYVIDPIGPKGKPLSKTAQVRACGNAVPPDFVEAIMASTFARSA